MGMYLRLASFLKTTPKEALIKVWIGLSIVATGFLQAFMIAGAITAIFERKSYLEIIPYIVGALLAIMAKAFLMRYQEGFVKKMGAKVKGNIRQTLIEKLLCLGPAYQDGRRSGNLQSLVTDGVESFEVFLVQYIPQVFVVMISVSAAILYIFTVDSVVSILIFLAAILAVIIPHLFMPAISKLMIEYWQSYAHLNAQYIDTMQGMSTLKAFQASKRTEKALEKDAKSFAKTSIDNTGMSLLDSAIIIFLCAVGTSLAVGIAAWHASQGLISPAGLLAILFLAGESMKPLYELNVYWHGSYLGFSVAEEFYEVLDTPVTLNILEEAKANHTMKNPPEIELTEVSFRYRQEAKKALDTVTIKIEGGQKVAVVGKSGSGKSTLVNLLLRFYDPQAGQIRIGGHELSAYTLDYLRNQIAVVFQDTYLFYGTVQENLMMAKPNATLEECIEAAKGANAHEFIMALPQGYQTMVGERGATLSGGQRQRLSIARTILKGAPILILDEATSSVDISGESQIQEALERLMKNRTTLIIAHRLSTIQTADLIYVLNKGRLWEAGTHEELIKKKNGVYKQLVQAQEKARYEI
ncbi:ABC transporter ATP-binding protein [Aminipila butyrica]|uniref:ABC transporter ATP-binding protein n=1 Tax=Aminipila butyrica TaxID=433296 RepID=A0A858BQD0_9FIRM|nr:ABC transporter ATP-binding protein [Aminipila butyrica]QIB68071.1 ABC transporter ATP-binding protein [Aminipila butyrica]